MQDFTDDIKELISTKKITLPSEEVSDSLLEEKIEEITPSRFNHSALKGESESVQFSWREKCTLCKSTPLVSGKINLCWALKV